jgi:hypothetical protein
MGFEDWMIDDGFSDPQEYLDYLEDRTLRSINLCQSVSSASSACFCFWIVSRYVTLTMTGKTMITFCISAYLSIF